MGTFISTSEKAIWKVPKISLEGAKNCVVISCTFLSNVTFGVSALTLVSIPLFLALRRMVTLFLYIYDIFFLQKPKKLLEFIGVVLITGGGLLAAVNDMYADLLGYSLVMLNNFATTIHFNLCKKLSQDKPEMDAGVQTFYMALLTIPVLVLICVFWEDNSSYQLYARPDAFYLALFLATIMGVLLTFSQSLCINVNSPIATSVTGNCKDILATVVGLFIFPDVHITFWLLVGLSASLGGAIIYSYSKLLDEMKNQSTKVK